MDNMTFEQAEDFKIPFGKYSGTTIGDVADIDIFYLVWLSGELKKDMPVKKDSIQYKLFISLNTFLSDPAVRDELANIM